MTDVFLVAAARTAVGAFGGALKDQMPGELAALVAREAITRAGIDASIVENVVIGNVIATEPRDAYVARIAAIGAGIPEASPALSVNRLCGSGLQAIISAAQSIMLGDHQIALAGGTEVMSRAPYFVPSARWGQRMGDGALLDGLNGALTDPFHAFHMGVTAENVGDRYKVS
jgi:acetyl-CoA C-acetyltransferase